MSQRRLFSTICFLVIFTLLLAACERPLPGSGDNSDANPPAETTDNTTTESTDGATTDGSTTTDGAAEEGDTDTGGDEATTNTDESMDEGSANADSGETATDEATTDSDESPREDETTEAADAYPGDEEETIGGSGDETTSEGNGTATDETGADEGAADDDAGANEEDDAAESGSDQEGDNAETGDEGTADTDSGDTADETADSGETTTPAEDSAATPETHTVANGENLYRIGLQYGISWVAIAQHNNLSNANQIVEGQVLKIPGGEESEEPAPEPTPSPQTEVVYTVQPGDNLYRIGLINNINWTQIAEANGIVNPNQITVGQQLKIPVDKPSSGQQSFNHTVQPRETLFLISLRYGVAWPAVAEANDLESPYVIFPGQTLVIPGK